MTTPTSTEQALQAAPASVLGGQGRYARFAATAPTWTGVGIVLVVLVGLLIATQPLFLTEVNITNILRGMSVTLLLATGTTFLITTGNLDLSIGALLALSTMILAGFVDIGVPMALAITLTIVVTSIGGGGVTGTLVSKAGLSFFVVTLGAMAIWRSAAQIPTSGLTIPLSDKPGFGILQWFGDGRLLGLSVPVVLSLSCLLAAIAVMRYTGFGRALFAVGGNPTAARLAGVPVQRVVIAAYALNAAFVGLGAVVFAGRIQAASPLAGVALELEVIAAVLLGGSSFAGGRSSFVGTFIGVLFVAVLQNGLNLLGVAIFWQGVVTGSVLILAVWVDRMRTRSQAPA